MSLKNEQSPRVLVVDDDISFCRILCDAFSGHGYDTSFSVYLEDGVKKACSHSVDVVLLDVHLPDGNGLNKIPNIMAAPSQPEVIIMTGDAEPDGAELAINNGAWSYIKKPVSMKNIFLQLTRVLQYREKKFAASYKSLLNRDRIIGKSPQMRSSLLRLGSAAYSDASVLITGETGTGKELFAHALHLNSSRASGSFVIVDCASMPETLVESVLFGHEKGSFTGADRVREGLIKLADGGTLFLDEVGEMPLSLQKIFLRVLESKKFRPIGCKREVYSNFRTVAATNQDLDAMVQKGLFRSDLLFRLRAFNIELPPLRTRSADIRELVMDYINRKCEDYDIEQKGFSPDFFETLNLYDWPGNVRELNQSMDMAIAEARHEPILFARHLPTYIRAKVMRKKTIDNVKPVTFDDAYYAERAPCKAEKAFQKLPLYRDFRQTALDYAERSYLQHLMDISGGSLKQARNQSGLGRTRLYTLLKKHNMVESR